jgi:hypothetical protein
MDEEDLLHYIARAVPFVTDALAQPDTTVFVRFFLCCVLTSLESVRVLCCTLTYRVTCVSYAEDSQIASTGSLFGWCFAQCVFGDRRHNACIAR